MTVTMCRPLPKPEVIETPLEIHLRYVGWGIDSVYHNYISHWVLPFFLSASFYWPTLRWSIVTKVELWSVTNSLPTCTKLYFLLIFLAIFKKELLFFWDGTYFHKNQKPDFIGENVLSATSRQNVIELGTFKLEVPLIWCSQIRYKI